MQSLDQALAKSKAKKTGLNRRVIQANRKAIKKLKGKPEIKWIESVAGAQQGAGDVDIDGEDSTGAPVRFNLTSGVAQGNTREGRDGAVITMKRMSVHVKFIPPSGLTAESANRCTAILVHDSKPLESGGLPTVQELYSLGSAQATLNTAFYNPHNVNTNKKRQETLKRRYTVLARKSIWVGSQPECMPEGYLSLGVSANYKLDYGTGTTTGSSCLNQTLRLFLYSDSANAPHPRYVVQAKMSYTDQ